MSTELLYSTTHNGKIILKLESREHTFAKPICCVRGFVLPGAVIATIDKITGEVEASHLRFFPWGKGKLRKLVERQLKTTDTYYNKKE